MKQNNIDIKGNYNVLLQDISASGINISIGIENDKFEKIVTELVSTQQNYLEQKNLVIEWIQRYNSITEQINVSDNDVYSIQAAKYLGDFDLENAENCLLKSINELQQKRKFALQLLEKTNQIQAKRNYQLGCIYELQFKYKQAITLYKQALEFNSNDFLVLNSLGIVYRNLGLYQNSIEIFNSIISKLVIDKKNLFYIISSINLSVLFRDIGDYENAAKILENILVNITNEQNYFKIEANKNLGLIYINLGRTKEATEILYNIFLTEISDKKLIPDYKIIKIRENIKSALGILFREIGDFEKSKLFFE